MLAYLMRRLAWAGVRFANDVLSERSTIQSIENFDLPTTQGVVVFATLCVISLNLVVDLLYAWIDPRIRFE